MTNPHFEEASALLANSPGEYEIEKSKALATVALAYEQRTANLIALYNMTEANCVGMSTAAPMSRENWDSSAKQIKERLGL